MIILYYSTMSACIPTLSPQRIDEDLMHVHVDELILFELPDGGSREAPNAGVVTTADDIVDVVRIFFPINNA